MSFYFAFVYEPASGRILRRVTCSEAEFSAYPVAVITSDQHAGSWDDTTHWVVDGKLTPRPLMVLASDKSQIAADGVETTMIIGIPTGAVMRIAGMPDEVVHDESVQFSTEVPGEYVIHFELFPYQDAAVRVIAV